MSKRLLSALVLVFVSFGCTPPDNRIDARTAPHTSPNQDFFIPVGLFDTALSGYWAIEPDIRICPNAGISPDRVRQALVFWEDVGYRFREIIEAESTGAPCKAGFGEIAFRVPTQQEISEALTDHRLGVTKTMIDRETAQIIKADIYFQHQMASHTPKIVEHELGHALGWKHHSRASHIMHPNLAKGGLSRIGMERRHYADKINEILKALEQK